MKKLFDKRHFRVYCIGEEVKTMKLTSAEKIDMIRKRLGVPMGDIAEKTGQTRQNLSNKMKRSNFSEKELETIAAALGCTVEITFTLPDGETI